MKIEDHHAAIRSDINLLRDTLKLGEDNKTAHKAIDGVLNLVDGFLCDIAVIARAHEPDIRLVKEPEISDEEYNSTRDWFYNVTQSDDYPPPGPLYDLAQRMLDVARTDQHALKNLMLEAFGTVVRALVSADITYTLASDAQLDAAEAPELTEDTVAAAFANKTERTTGQTPQHKLAKELKDLCCAETEGKFFNTVTENIGKITEALNAHGDMKDYMAEIGMLDPHKPRMTSINWPDPELLKQAGLQITQNEQGHWVISEIEIQPGDGSLMAQPKPGTPAFQTPIAPTPEEPLQPLPDPCANPECGRTDTYYNPLASLCHECTTKQAPAMTTCPQCGRHRDDYQTETVCSIATCPMH